MKKNTLLVIFFLAIIQAGLAQAKIELGLKGGINLSNINTESTAGENYKSAAGFNLGAYTLVKLTKIGIQPEILYSTKGSKIALSGTNSDLNQNLTYLDIPVMLKIYTLFGINLQVGPQVSILLAADQDEFDGTTIAEEVDIKDQLKPSDFSLALGAGWDSKSGLSFSGRYLIGLNNINDITGEKRILNRVWQFSLGYRLAKIGK